MRRQKTLLLSVALILSFNLASVCLISGCGDSNETGTTVAKPKEAAEGERKSMEGMKNMMKGMPGAKKK